jgi:thymidylate synthase (FAD)
LEKGMNKIEVLDKGFVSYVSHMGNDLTVVNAARVSFNKQSEYEKIPNQNFMDDYGEADEHVPYKEVLSLRDKKLIRYLAENKHWTPFSHPQITLRIKAPIFVRTQLFKHKVGFTENEISRRYVTFEAEVYKPVWRDAPKDGAKQGSSGLSIYNKTADDVFNAASEKCLIAYKNLLTLGIAPEQARSVLPQGTYTEWWWTGSLSAYARVYQQRIDSHAQWEVQQYAKAIGDILEPLYPESWKVLTESINKGHPQ